MWVCSKHTSQGKQFPVNVTWQTWDAPSKGTHRGEHVLLQFNALSSAASTDSSCATTQLPDSALSSCQRAHQDVPNYRYVRHSHRHHVPRSLAGWRALHYTSKVLPCYRGPPRLLPLSWWACSKTTSLMAGSSLGTVCHAECPGLHTAFSATVTSFRKTKVRFGLGRPGRPANSIT